MILVDSAEPDEIVQLLKQTADVSVQPLNQSSRADYYFGGEDNKSRQFCRVQAGELLGNIDSQEDELRRYYNEADYNYLIIEGIITDTPITKKDKSIESVSVRMQSRPSTLFTYRVTPGGWVHGEHAYDIGADLFYAWLFRLSECGVISFTTHNYIGTAKCISAIYRNCQKPVDSHNTLNRYYIPRIKLGEKDDEGKRITIRKQNPLIRGLMALSIIYSIDIGEKKATALYDYGYHSLYDMAFASVDELVRVDGIGKTTAKKLLAAIGVEE
ncbi:hypothetical protein LCGC14_2847720 [marine sediment metagenome]|uniref:Helix-hairpin-helix DNA-binding motif class 1 domain-containing protein n=1 Tax=marine sediment metagenome TaxID=412755 RepID=A0A0F8Y9H8_9ZZZZ